MRWSVGGSVASARAPSVSMIRFTQRSCTGGIGKWNPLYTTEKMDFQSNPSPKEYTGEGIKKEQIERERERERSQTCTALSGTLPAETAATTFIIRAATLTVSWNWINFWIFAYTDLPHRTTCNWQNQNVTPTELLAELLQFMTIQ